MLDMKVLETEVRKVLTARRDAGIEWLNSDKPEWAKEIDLDTFDFASPSDCVIGQTYGRYGTVNGKPDTMETFEFSYTHGFTIHAENIIKDLPYMGEDDEDEYKIYSYIDGPAWLVMNELWKESIKELQAA